MRCGVLKDKSHPLFSRHSPLAQKLLVPATEPQVEGMDVFDDARSRSPGITESFAFAIEKTLELGNGKPMHDHRS